MTNSVSVWFVYYLVQGEPLAWSTWDRSWRVFRAVRWAEEEDRRRAAADLS